MFYYFKYLARTWYWRFKNREYYSQELRRHCGRIILSSVIMDRKYYAFREFRHEQHELLKSCYNAAWMCTYTNCFRCIVF